MILFLQFLYTCFPIHCNRPFCWVLSIMGSGPRSEAVLVDSAHGAFVLGFTMEPIKGGYFGPFESLFPIVVKVFQVRSSSDESDKN